MNYIYVIKYTYLIEVSLFPLLKIYWYTKNEKITNIKHIMKEIKDMQKSNNDVWNILC